MKPFYAFLVPLIFLSGCAGNPVAAKPVAAFEADRYLGTWYEIARLDHVFERDLEDVTATYSKRDDGKFTVLNRGYKTTSGKLKTAKGKAKFGGDENLGHLKVSFFGPFYGDYIIFDLEQSAYSTAYISGGKDNYLWLLSRTPIISDEVRRDFIAQSKALGYDTDDLIWVEQTRAIQDERNN